MNTTKSLDLKLAKCVFMNTDLCQFCGSTFPWGHKCKVCNKK